MLNKLIRYSSECNPKTKTYEICVLYKTQTGLRKKMDRLISEKSSTGNFKNHFWRSLFVVKGF